MPSIVSQFIDIGLSKSDLSKILKNELKNNSHETTMFVEFLLQQIKPNSQESNSFLLAYLSTKQDFENVSDINSKVLDLLFRNNANPNLTIGGGKNTIHLVYRNLNAIEILFRYGAKGNIQDAHGNTVLHELAQSVCPYYKNENEKKYYQSIINLLLQNNVNPDIKNYSKKKPKDLYSKSSGCAKLKFRL